MNDERNLEPLPDLPPDLAELDRELAGMGMQERPSFAPELEAELAREWARRPPGSQRPWMRQTTAAAAVLVAILGLSVPPARASLVEGVQRLLAGLQETPGQIEVELPVAADEPMPIGAEEADADPPTAQVPGLADMETSLALGEEPPFAQGVMTYPTLLNRNADAEAARRHYPRALQLAGIGGTVELALWVDSTGMVDHAQVSESSGTPELDRAARRAARDLEFRPLTRDGRPDGTWVTFPLTFTPADDVVRVTGPEAASVPAEMEWYPETDWSRGVTVPAPILMETRELLESALDMRSELVRGLGPMDGLVEGEPPRGTNPLQWRNRAAEALQIAMQRDPDNPAPYLALARVRRKQGLRNDARLLFEQGLARANKGTRPISPRLVAELAWEHGRVTRESWLGWRGLGEVPAEVLRGPGCSLISGTGVGSAPVEELIAWNFNCPAVVHHVLREDFRLRPEGAADADRMLTSFRAAVEAEPAHVEANTEILLAMADEEAWIALLNGARRFASASRGHPTAFLMSGLALHRLGRSEEAVADFGLAFDRMESADADRFRDPGVLRASDDEPAGRSFWQTLDPILSTPVNEREVEHWSRAAYAQLRFGSLEADASRVWLRYGRPLAIRAFGSGSGIRTEFWDYGRGPDITFHRPLASANGALTPEAEDYLVDLRGVFPHQYGTRARAAYALPAQVSHFRGRMLGSTEVEFDFEIPREMVRSSTDSLDLGLFYLGRDGRPIDAIRQRVAADGGPVRRLAPAGPEVRAVAVELWNAETGMAAGVRVAAHLPDVPGDGSLSGLMLVDTEGEITLPIDRADLRFTPRANTRIDDSTVGVLLELYDFPTTAAPYRLTFEMVDDDGRVRTLEHRPAGVGSWATSWTRRPTLTDAVTEFSTLRLETVPAGRWTLRAVIERNDGRRLVRELGGLTRGVEAESAPREPGSWEGEWDRTGWLEG